MMNRRARALVPILLATAAVLWCAPFSAAGESLAEAVDRFVSEAQARTHVPPAGPADDAEFVRRVYLDLVGRIPRRAEARRFLDDPDPVRRARLIDQLLASAEYAAHWRENWHTYLMGSAPFTGDREWREWLEKALRTNRGWDSMVRTMLRARPARPEDRGATHFLISRFAQGPTGLDAVTRDVSRLFFGVDVQCARCHKHPEVDLWKQDVYWGMAAFWNRSYTLPVKGKVYLAERATGEVEYTTRSRATRVAKPHFLGGEAVREVGMTIAPAGPRPKGKGANPTAENPADYVVAPETAAVKTRVPLPKYSRREKLIELAVNPKNPYFKRAAVNYVWSQLFGRGLVEPIDQMHEANPASHPELLAYLADDFAAHGFDLRYLIGGVVKSQTYQRTSRWPAGTARPAETSYACAAVRPLSSHQLALSLLVAAGYADTVGKEAKGSDAGAVRAALERKYAAVLNELVSHLAGGSAPYQPGIREALFQANSAAFADLVAKGGLADRLAGIADDRALARELFECVLSRAPAVEESARVSGYLHEHGRSRPAACRQIVWALLASAEFRFNH